MICSSGLHSVCWELVSWTASILRSFTLPSLWVLFFSSHLDYLGFSLLGRFIRDIGQISSFLGLALLFKGVFYSLEAEASAPVYGNAMEPTFTDYRCKAAISQRATELVSWPTLGYLVW